MVADSTADATLRLIEPLWIDGTFAVDAGYDMSLEAAVLPVVQAQVFTDENGIPRRDDPHVRIFHVGRTACCRNQYRHGNRFEFDTPCEKQEGRYQPSARLTMLHQRCAGHQRVQRSMQCQDPAHLR